jgi:hypothetical protein
MTSYSLSEEVFFPYFTIPHFEQRADDILKITSAIAVILAPIVPKTSKTFYEQYAQENQQWIEDGLQFGGFNGTHNTTAPHIYSPDPREDTETVSDGFYLPTVATRSSSNPLSL